MRTSTTAALLATMLAIGCAPIGGDDTGRHPITGVDAGSAADSTCDTPSTQSMDIEVSSNAAIDSLPTSCWKLDGTLTVDGSTTSLAKLGDLRGVTNLIINGSQLTKLDTPMPISVTQSINIENNSLLTDLTNLSLPTDSSCGTYLAAVSVTGNPLLTSLGGVNQVRCVSGVTTIQNNVKLDPLDLSNAVRLEGGLTIQDNTALTGIMLTALTSVTDGITIKNNAALTSLGTWSALMFDHGPLTIDSNASITTLAGTMPTASIMIEGALTITNNAKLTEVGEFDHLVWASSINVSNNAALDYCDARQIGCCVPDSDPQSVTTAQISGNKDTQCNGASSWCFGPDGNKCRNDYTGYTGNL